MKRYYFYKRNTNLRPNLKGDVIAFSLSALYSTKAYSQKLRKEICQYHYFDDIDLCVSTKTPGIYKVDVDAGTDGCKGHGAISFKELQEGFARDGYSIISEREYFRLRKLALRLIFKYINFFYASDPAAERKYFCQNDCCGSFYNVKLISTSKKYNIRNYDEKQIEYGAKIGLPLNDLRIDEVFRIFITKDKNYKSTTFSIESSHFNGYYENYEKFVSGNFWPKDKTTMELQEFQFTRLKKLVLELLLDRSSLDISNILQKQTGTVTILDL